MAKSKKSGTQKSIAENKSGRQEALASKDSNATAPAKRPFNKKLLPAPSAPSLCIWNKWLAVLFAVQGLAILAFSATRTFPLTTNFLTPDPVSSELAGHPVLGLATRHLHDVNMAYLVAIFLFIAAVAHTAAATVYRKRYEADLERGVNKVRWLEYGLGAGTMLVAIGFLSGIADLSTFIMIFVLTLVVNLMGLTIEAYNRSKGASSWLAHVVGCVAGLVPWAVIAIYVFGTNAYGHGHVPAFMYWIYGSMFVLFGGFAANMYLQYKKKGRWANYLYGERLYMILSLVAKTALAWQIFAGSLRP